ncbi:MAG: hypothetical protein K2H93_08880 [Oscillospiraceae bacterium]|nr:hypothetical protein [Oscillospiraceae bacterium]
MDKKYSYEQRKLSFQLVPETVWGSNLRLLLANWNEISRIVRSTGKCAICGMMTKQLHAHEVWCYDDENHVQILDNIIAVCKNCHNAIHIGYANVQGKGQEALVWYAKINKISIAITLQEEKEAFKIWRERSCFAWQKEKNLLEKIKKITGIAGLVFDSLKPINGKYYLRVPFEEKDEAKKYGAKWDAVKKMWYYVNPNDKEKFQKWLWHVPENLS